MYSANLVSQPIFNPEFGNFHVEVAFVNDDANFPAVPNKKFDFSNQQMLNSDITNTLNTLNTLDLNVFDLPTGPYIPTSNITPDEQVEADYESALNNARQLKEIADIKASSDPDVQAAVVNLEAAKSVKISLTNLSVK